MKLHKLSSVITVLILLSAVAQIASPVKAQTCAGEDEDQANRYLQLATTFENQGEMNKAAEYYELAALSPCPDQVTMGIDGLERVLNQRNNWLIRYLNDLDRLSLTIGLGAIQFVGIFVIAYIFVRIVLWRIARSRQLVIMPLEDHMNVGQGELVAEALVSKIHEIRLIHSDKPIGVITPSENVDMPSFSNMTYRDSLLKALGGIDSFDVSGMGLPIGSLLSSIVNWFDMGRTRIHGHVRIVGTEIEIVVRLEEGRDGRCGKLWRISKPAYDDIDDSETLQEIIEELSYHILMDTTTEGWGTSSPNALRFYTRGLMEIRKFYTSDSRDINALRKAHELFVLALRDDPIYSYATYNLGIVELNLGNYENAINHFKDLELLEIQPYKAEIYYNMGIAYYYRTRDWAYDMAEDAFEEVLKCYPQSPKHAYHRQLLSLTYSGLILVNAQKSRLEPPNMDDLYSASLEHFQSAKELAIGNSTITAQALYSMAVLYQNRRNWVEAEKYIQKALALNPYHWRAYTTYGQISLAIKDYDKAIMVLDKAINLSPSYEYAQYLLGRALTAKGQPAEAISAFAKAPNIARAHDEWGRILALNGDYDQAIDQFEQAAVMNSQFSDAFGNIAWYLAEGDMLGGEGFQRAVESAKREIELCKKTPREWHGYAILGHVYYYHRDLDAAREALDTANKLNKNSSQIYYYLSMIDFDEGDYQSARENLIKLFQLKIKDDWQNKATILMNEIKRKLEEN